MIAKATPAKSKASCKNILVIEDEGEMCLLLNLILVDKGHNVAHVKNLSDAEHFLQQMQPSLILLDNRLPDGYGFDFICYLKTNYPNIKIIMISGVDKAAGDSALEAGADVFLTKPFTRAALLQSVNELIN
ncbi:MAG TPA: response regulator [Puia sp.]|jgi:two-component system OmpR family response regulator|nr:response regulator [Puia sp.]